MIVVSVQEAVVQISKLLDDAQAGEVIIIARDGTPVARLMPMHPPKRLLGRWRSQVRTLADDEWATADRAVTEVFDASLK